MESTYSRIKRIRFSTFDWILVAILILAISLTVWLFADRNYVRKEAVEIRYLLLIEEISFDLKEAWARTPVGSAVTNGSGTATLGWVESVDVEPTRFPSVVGGKVVTVESADRFNVTVAVTGHGSDEGAQGLRILSHRIAAGGTGSFRVGNCYAANARIVGVEYLPEEEG